MMEDERPITVTLELGEWYHSIGVDGITQNGPSGYLTLHDPLGLTHAEAGQPIEIQGKQRLLVKEEYVVSIEGDISDISYIEVDE